MSQIIHVSTSTFVSSLSKGVTTAVIENNTNIFSASLYDTSTEEYTVFVSIEDANGNVRSISKVTKNVKQYQGWVDEVVKEVGYMEHYQTNGQ